MRLSEFISTQREQILLEWDAFARTCFPDAQPADWQSLRDHAARILETIATDLNTPQSKSEQAAKSEGKSDAVADGPAADTAAQEHGDDRAASGFDLKQMVSEYRALRASVIRLWIAEAGELALDDIEDVMRFNEAIDQALAESSARYAQNIERAKEMFIAMLGHDLRTPLGAVIASANAMANTRASPETVTRAASVILSSGQRMNALVNDLLDFTRSRLGAGIPIVRTDMDLEKVCRQTVEELAAFHPQSGLSFSATGALRGAWDAARVCQALSNVIGNAVQYGADDTPINVTLRGDADEVLLAVQNQGAVIPASQLNRIFDPMHRLEDDGGTRGTNLGLGLYITERIVVSHGGKISVESSAAHGTTFTMRLPKRLPDVQK